MAVTVTAASLKASYDEAGMVYVYATATFSGTYPAAGGDPVDLSTLNVFGVRSDKAPLRVAVYNGNGGIAHYVPGSSSKNGAIKWYVEQAVGTNTVLAEHSNVAYVAAITGDTVTLEILWQQFV